MVERKPISKGKRFDIFRRDGFICQYCGRQPPEVILQVDHITPVIEGGTNDEMNLVTACRDCNLGKGKKLLDNPPQRPDADLAWLEMQQELAELKAYQALKQERDALLEQIVTSLQHTWAITSGLDWCPAKPEIHKMLTHFDPDIVELAIRVTAVKEANGQLRGSNGWLRYLWGTLKGMARERGNDD
jgi:hypothetical protein